MTTHTNLSSEEPSERASTGPKHLRMAGSVKAEALGMDASAELEVPAGSRFEKALTIAVLFIGAATAIAILVTANAPEWCLWLTIACYLASTAIVFARKRHAKNQEGRLAGETQLTQLTKTDE